MTPGPFFIKPIGFVRLRDERSFIEIMPDYRDAMDGLDGFSHINVLFWFHENDHPEGRSVLKVHPRKDPNNPLTGVFATHSPLRPNLIGITLCRIQAIDGTRIEVDAIDAREGTPVIDIKCFIPTSRPLKSLRLPEWV
ncbi:MAG: tRNA (N6-threonylcarbamoyladenosine(37)-N6)-methyltransferase TrmO [Desulfobacterales bacterium]|jgi:tRNA-Thr(GGU) m(6)t(6)A37 methyltransferase TsaA